jgi:hypothetical protein
MSPVLGAVIGGAAANAALLVAGVAVLRWQLRRLAAAWPDDPEE